MLLDAHGQPTTQTSGPDSILQDILDQTKQTGVYELEESQLTNGVFSHHPVVKSMADLRQWAQENNLRMEQEMKAGKRGKLTAYRRFSRL